MLKINWKTWLAVWVAIALVTGGLVTMLSLQGATTASTWAGFAGNLLITLWTALGLYRWREITLVKRLNSFVITLVGFGLLFTLFYASAWEPGWRTTAYLAIAVLGFLAGVNLLRLLLRPSHPILGVARTTIEEALRMGIALIFIVGLLVLLVMMPLVLGSEDRVTYMVQRFLTYSTAVMSALLGLMTVLLAARTVSLELSSRQAHMTLTKPLARWQYLLGKWLGIVMLNAVLVAVGGVAIYGFTMAIAMNPALNDLDRYAVDREVLTARLAIRAEPADISWGEMTRNVLEEKQARDPEKFGQVGDPVGALPLSVKQEIIAETGGRFYTVDGGASKQYRFEGLKRAADAAARAQDEAREMLRDEAGLSELEAADVVNAAMGRKNDLEQETLEKITPGQVEALQKLLEREVIQLELSPKTSPRPDNLFVEITTAFNGQPWPPPQSAGLPQPRRTLVVETKNEIAIPAGLIDSDGTLIVTIGVPRNRSDGLEQKYVAFNHKDAEVGLFYRVGSFGSNLARGLVLIWLKLCFFAMAGLVAGSLVSFPVAAMAGLIVFAAATFSGIIQESLDSFASIDQSRGTWGAITSTFSQFFYKIGNGEIYDALRVIIRLIGESFMLVVPSFGDFPVADPLSNGRAIENKQVLNAIFKIGLLWTGIIGLLGLYFFSRKEIARVTV